MPLSPGSAPLGALPTLQAPWLRSTSAARTPAGWLGAAGDTSTAATVLQWATFLTAIVAVGGLIVTIRGQQKDAKLERNKRHDEQLARWAQDLGSDTPRVRLNAAAALSAFLGSGSPGLRVDLLAVIIANLKIEPDRPVSDVLVRDLEVALRACLEPEKTKWQFLHPLHLLPTSWLPLKRRDQLSELDLARALWLKRLDISKSDLSGLPVDLAFANLRQANLCDVTAPRNVRGWGVFLEYARLSRANLHEARLNKSHCAHAQFHKTRLVSATFKGADLRGASFQQAKLQAVHFERAWLQGAKFEEANVADTYFCDMQHNNAAKLDDSALMSLSTARNLDRAHLTPEHKNAVCTYLVQRGKLNEAQRCYDQSIKAHMSIDGSALRRLGDALRSRGSNDQAEFWFRQANSGDGNAHTEGGPSPLP